MILLLSLMVLAQFIEILPATEGNTETKRVITRRVVKEGSPASVILRSAGLPECANPEKSGDLKILGSVLDQAEREISKNKCATQWSSPDGFRFDHGRFKDINGKYYKITNFRLTRGIGWAKELPETSDSDQKIIKISCSENLGKRHCEYADTGLFVKGTTYSYDIEPETGEISEPGAEQQNED
jgi:hypothetical protein